MKEQQPPKYMQLKEEIVSWIAMAEFKPHDKLPSENEIAARFGFSRQTVRQALGDLETEGWLYRSQGKGTFVAEAEPEQARPEGQQKLTIGMMTTHISDYIFPTIVRGWNRRCGCRERDCCLQARTTRRKGAGKLGVDAAAAAWRPDYRADEERGRESELWIIFWRSMREDSVRHA